MSYSITEIGQLEHQRLDEKITVSPNPPDADYIKWLIFEAINLSPSDDIRFIDVFAFLAKHGYRSPRAANLAKGIFFFLKDRGFIEETSRGKVT